MACKIYTVYIYMYKTCFLVKGEHSLHTKTHTHTHTHTHTVTIHLLYKPHTHNNVPKLRVWLLLIQKYQDKHFLEKLFNGIVLLSILTHGI